MFVLATGFALVPLDRQVAAQVNDNWIYAFDYSALAGKYATGHYDWTIRIWDATTNDLLHTIQAPNLRSGFADAFSIKQVAFSRMGDRLAAGLFGDGQGEIMIIDTSTGQTLVEISDIPSIGAIAWSPDGELLAGIYYYTPLTPVLDGFLGLWDTRTGQQVNQHLIGTSPVALAWHPFDARLAFGDSGFLVVWDVEQWQELYRISADENGVISVAWSPSGDTIAAIGTEEIVRLWDGSTGELQRAIDAGNSGKDVPGVFWSQGGEWVGVSFGKHIEVWDPETGVSVFSYEAEKHVKGIAVLADGSIIFASGDTVQKLETPLPAIPWGGANPVPVKESKLSGRTLR
jgi:WD40 repeat protein